MSPLNCKTFRVGVYKRLPLIVGFALDCLQSAFSLKICLVLTSSSAIANNDVIITIRDYALVSRGSPLACLGFACSNFAKKNKSLLAVYPNLQPANYTLRQENIPTAKKNYTHVAIQVQAFRRIPKKLRLFSRNKKA